MTAADKYELYRVILDYEALQDGFLDRIDDLNTTMEQVELLAGFARGNAQKLLTKNPGKAIARLRDHRSASAKRTFGWESLGKMLEGTGLALVLVVDDERFAPMKAQLAKRRRRREPAMAGSARPTWLFKKDKAREMGKKRFALMTESERKRHQRRAGKASGKVRRSRLKQQQAVSCKSRALVEQPAPQLHQPGLARPVDAHAPRSAPLADQVPRNPC